MYEKKALDGLVAKANEYLKNSVWSELLLTENEDIHEGEMNDTYRIFIVGVRIEFVSGSLSRVVRG